MGTLTQYFQRYGDELASMLDLDAIQETLRIHMMAAFALCTDSTKPLESWFTDAQLWEEEHQAISDPSRAHQLTLTSAPSGISLGNARLEDSKSKLRCGVYV